MQENLLLIRNRHGFTKTYVANYLGISLKQYSAKENGQYAFDSDEMFALSKLFDKRIDEIFLPRGHRNGDKEKV